MWFIFAYLVTFKTVKKKTKHYTMSLCSVTGSLPYQRFATLLWLVGGEVMYMEKGNMIFDSYN